MRYAREVWPNEEELVHLVREAQSGGLGALDVLLARLRPSFVAYFAPSMGRDDAEDAAQTALLSIVRTLPRIDAERAAGYVLAVAKVRGSEALDLLDAWATGHPGGVATVHASSPEGALLRLDRLAQRANVPPQRHLVAEAVHLIAVLEGAHARRRLTDLVRVEGLDRDGHFILHRPSTTDVPSPGDSL